MGDVRTKPLIQICEVEVGNSAHLEQTPPKTTLFNNKTSVENFQLGKTMNFEIRFG